jgi:hypothetical protein
MANGVLLAINAGMLTAAVPCRPTGRYTVAPTSVRYRERQYMAYAAYVGALAYSCSMLATVNRERAYLPGRRK